ncbi:MAG: LysR family transcriptional regulator [Nannocystaceae bacterium]
MPERGDYDLEDLRAFGIIARAGGISEAARELGLAKATLSRALARLEAAARTPLFDRVDRGMRLTPLGEALLRSAEQLERLAEEADLTLRAALSEPQGPLRIAASAIATAAIVAPAIARMAARYPEVRTSLRTDPDGPDPLSDDLDVVLRVARPREPHLISRRILAATLRLYAAKEVAAGIDVDDPAAVEALGRVVIDAAGVPREWLLTGPGGARAALTREPVVTVSEPLVAVGVLEGGLGVALLPALYGERKVAEGRFIRLLPDLQGETIEIFAIYPPRRASVPAVRAFIDILLDEAQRYQETPD